MQRLRIFLVVLLLMFAKKNSGQIIPHNIKCDTTIQYKYDCILGNFSQMSGEQLRKIDSLQNITVQVIKCDTICLFKKFICPDPEIMFSSKGKVLSLIIDSLKNEADSILKNRIPFIICTPISIKNFYINSLGFFCEKELRLEKITSIALRLRLGSLDYTNYLEQKPNALKPN